MLEKCMPDFPPEKHAYCQPWASYVNDYDIVVLKMGLHVVSTNTRYRELMTGAVAALKAAKYEGEVIFLTSRAGHTFCDKEDYRPEAGLVRGPILPGQEISPYEDYWDPAYASHQWYAISGFNQIAKEVFTEAGHKVVDLYPLLRLRPDGHRGGNDCLHYNFPGPVDHSVLLLYNAILGWI
ncbi:unnamed protein product [Choristocarpus tenellus]